MPPYLIQVCAWRVGRERLLAYLRGDVGQWRRVMAEGPPEGPLPAAARTALAEAAAALRAELDVAQLAGVGCEGATARVGGWGVGVRRSGSPAGLGQRVWWLGELEGVR